MTDQDYDPEKNAYGSWRVAIRACRLNAVLRGEDLPRQSDPEEMAAWREGVITDAVKKIAERKKP